MRRKTLILVLLAPLIAITASAHDLFLKLDSYILQPHSRAIVRVLNGTFQIDLDILRGREPASVLSTRLMYSLLESDTGYCCLFESDDVMT